MPLSRLRGRDAPATAGETPALRNLAMTILLLTDAVFITAALAYLLGSIPSGYILVRVFRGEDVRQSGSGNIGATNVARSSTTLGVLTLILDTLKGLAAVLLARALFPGHGTLPARRRCAQFSGTSFRYG